MHGDSFVKGAHPICQDYVVVGKSSAFLSDGCSSSPRSEIGAHILPMLAEYCYLNKITSFGDYSERVLNTCPWDSFCYDATLLALIFVEKEISFNAIGDGVIIFKWKDGGITIYEIDYTDNAPFYVSYALNSNKKDQYLSLFPNNKVEVKCYNGGEIRHAESSIATKVYSNYFLTSFYESVFIASDGIKSFQDNTGKPMDLMTIAKEIVNIPNYTGVFLQRRMNKLLKDFAKQGITAYDDVSIAGFYLGEET